MKLRAPRSSIPPLVFFLLATTAFGDYPHLRAKNTFKTPEEVVQYYCARDAAGFVWSGMLDEERKEFTLWNEVPHQDSFYIAKKYEIGRSQAIKHDKNHVQINVKYDLLALGDAHGTRFPATDPELHVVFELQKTGNAWKISKPDPRLISPVVLESRFAFPSPSASQKLQR